MYVQEWLINLNLTATTKGKIKALMHRLFERAMFWELIRSLGTPDRSVSHYGGCSPVPGTAGQRDSGSAVARHQFR